MLLFEIAFHHFIYLIYIDIGETDCLPINYDTPPEDTSSDK